MFRNDLEQGRKAELQAMNTLERGGYFSTLEEPNWPWCQSDAERAHYDMTREQNEAAAARERSGCDFILNKLTPGGDGVLHLKVDSKVDKWAAKKESFFVEVCKAPAGSSKEWGMWEWPDSYASWGIKEWPEQRIIIVVDKLQMRSTDKPQMWAYQLGDMREFMASHYDSLEMKTASSGYGGGLASYGYIVPMKWFETEHKIYYKGKGSDTWHAKGKGRSYTFGELERFRTQEDAKKWLDAAERFPELKEKGLLR